MGKESVMLPIGTQLPSFALPDVDGKIVQASDFANNISIVIMFICNHCPYVIRINDSFKDLSDFCKDNDVGLVAINSNSLETHPQDGPEHMKALANEKCWDFPFLFDESQEVAKSFKGACTPDIYLFNKEDDEFKLFYRGRYDAARPRNDELVTGQDLRNAINLALSGEDPPVEQIPSMGCNIKFTPGNEPEYFG